MEKNEKKVENKIEDEEIRKKRPNRTEDYVNVKHYASLGSAKNFFINVLKKRKRDHKNVHKRKQVRKERTGSIESVGRK